MKKKQSINTNYFNTHTFPSNYKIFFFKSLLLWLLLNIGTIFIYSAIFYLYDAGNHVSNFNGLPDGKRHYYEYLYLSSMIGTIVGFGDITAKRNLLTKFIIISEVIVILFVNFAFFSFKELKLADDPDNTY